MDRWRNKVAIVTGASGGIGAAIAEKLVEENIIVVGLARRKEQLEELSRKINNDKTYFYPYVTDMANEDDIIKAFNWATTNLGPIHILINNAGILYMEKLINCKTKSWEKVFDTNVIGLSIATREAIRNMKENNVSGHIIHINSTSGHKTGIGPVAYTASKFAVTALTEVLRNELVSKGSKIKVTSISPGAVKTGIMKAAIKESQDPSFIELEKYVNTIPMLEPNDIANGVLYVLGTPPHVQILELTIKPVGESF